MAAPDFEATVDQGKHVPAGQREMTAIISVTYGGAQGEVGAPPPTAAQVIMIDCSSSMEGAKLIEAKTATAAAIDALRDDVAFAVVSGTTTARMVYPANRQLAPASATTRGEAKAAVRRLTADGGTVIGAWLELANELLTGQSAQIKHGILLTDGRNEHQTPTELNQVLQRCQGNFVCDSRGVGVGWSAATLLAIADRLHGSAEGLLEPAELTADFRAINERVMGKATADASLRIWTPADVRILVLEQMEPRIADLTEHRSAVSARINDYPTGQWGVETKVYRLRVEVPAAAVGEERAVARVSVVVDDQESSEQTVWIQWTDDPVLSTKINPKVAYYTGQVELSEAINDGLAARAAGKVDIATAKLGQAIQLAADYGHDHTVKVLSRLVEVDPVNGTVRLRSNVDDVHAEMAALESRKTIRTRTTEEP